MDTHKSVSLTPEGREMMVRVVVDFGLSKAAAARQFNTTPKTVAKWIERFEADGADGWCDRSSRPHSSPSQAAPPSGGVSGILCAGPGVHQALTRSMADPSSWRRSKTTAARTASNLSSCRPNGPISKAPSSAPNPAGDTSSTPHTTCQIASTGSACRRLRPPLQPLQAPPGSWRQNPRRVSPISQLRDQVVSDVLNPDKPLRRSRFDTTFSGTRFGPP